MFMQTHDVTTAEDARQIINERGLDYVKVGLFDIDGVLRGKYMAKDKFLSALKDGFGFCDVVLGWDSQDQLYDNVAFTGWHTGYGDATVRIIPESCRELPLEQNALLFLTEFSGEAAAICPRGILQSMIKKAEVMGLIPYASCEFEFFLFDETPNSVRDKHYKNLNTISPGFFGYSVLRSSVFSDFYEELLSTCMKMDMPLEGLHTETGPGVLEAAIAYDKALEGDFSGAQG